MSWRTDVPPAPYSLWQGVISRAGGPDELASRAAWEAAGGLSGLCLAMLHVESQYGTAFNLNRPERKNYLNLRPPTGDGYLLFPTVADGIRTWRDRITSPTYKGGIYAQTMALADLVHVYAPSSDGNDEREYVDAIERLLDEWGLVTDSGSADTVGSTSKGNVMSVVFGQVPYPDVVQSHLPASNPYVVESGAPDIPDAVFWHRMVGSLLGTDGHFHGGNAATAYGVGVAAWDGVLLAGTTYEWIAPRNGWYGESSGPAEGPYGDGAVYVQQVGVGSINRRSKAIEISGDYDTPLDDDARDAIADMTAYWADQKRIPWDEFPMIADGSRSFVIWHNEITGLAYKQCPGSVVMRETSGLIERTRAVLKRYQQGSPTLPAYAPKKPIPGPVVSQEYGGKAFVRAVGGLTLRNATAPLQYASPTARPTGKPYAADRKVSPAYSTIGDDGELWIVERNGNRFPFSAFKEAV